MTGEILITDQIGNRIGIITDDYNFFFFYFCRDAFYWLNPCLSFMKPTFFLQAIVSPEGSKVLLLGTINNHFVIPVIVFI